MGNFSWGGAAASDNNNSVSIQQHTDELANWEQALKRINSGMRDEDIFDAILLGTDTDYLETSRLRGIFRENAITDADVTLFELTGSDSDGMGNSPFPQTPIDLEFRSRSWWHQLIHIPPNIILAQMSLPLQLFHHFKYYLFTLLIVTLLVFVIFKVDRSTTTSG